MKINKSILIIIVVATLLIAPVSAQDIPDEIQVAHTEWAVAGSGNAVPIIVRVVNITYPYTEKGVGLERVRFTLNNSDYGSLSTGFADTDGTGYAQILFTPKDKSGNVSITASLQNYPVSITFNQRIDHNSPYRIKSVDYPTEQEVYSETDIIVRMTDRYGNNIDSKREDFEGRTSEKIRFSCSRSARFTDASDPQYYAVYSVDRAGNTTAHFQLSPIAGENVIFIDPVDETAGDQWITIYGTGLQYPSSMKVTVIPSSRELPIGGPTFTIIYELFDTYGNPSPNANVTLTIVNIDGATSIQEKKTKPDGTLTMTTVPQNSIGTVTITATTDNPEVSDVTTLTYTWPTGEFMQFTAIPDTMPSLDIDSQIQSELIVTLAGGNVVGETVRFTVRDVTPAQPGSMISQPFLKYKDTDISAGLGPATVTTNYRGQAVIYFVPGEFDQSYGWTNATCWVDAEWYNGTGVIESASIKLTWMNEPYISVETVLDPNKAAYAPGETIYVEIWLKGDGFPVLVSQPVDVMLVMNRGDSTFGDMYWSEGSFTEDKIVWAVYGAWGFVNAISDAMGGANQLGLLTYGPIGETNLPNKLPGIDNSAGDDMSYIVGPVDPNPPLWDNYYSFNAGHYPGYIKDYSYYDSLDLGLDDEIHNIQDELANITPSSTDGGTDLCPMRYALYKSISHIDAKGRDDTEKAIVLLTDRQWDSGGDILAGGTWNNDTRTWSPEVKSSQANTNYDYEDNWPQSGFGAWRQFGGNPEDPNENMAIYAANNNIKVYVLAYPNKANNIPTSIQEALKALAYSTGGKYYLATSGEEIYADFQAIADELKKAAAVNTSMSVDFIGKIEGQPELTYTVEEVFDYVSYVPNPMPGISKPHLTNESTAIRHWNWSEGGSKDLFMYGSDEIANYAFNQSSDWEDDQTLIFDESRIGTINIKETWMTRFGLAINSSINETIIFNLFGLNTNIYFKYGDSMTSIPIPPAIIVVNPEMAADPSYTASIDVLNLTNGTITLEKVPLSWNLDYSGTDENLTEIIQVKELYGGWNTLLIKEVSNTTCCDSYDWIIQDLPLGLYTVKVTAISDDAGFDSEILDLDTTFLFNPPFIKIE
jgi:hypothetical protein